MPKRVDHEQRRREISEAARAVILRAGLAAATFGRIAQEAGCSVRLVQYYFGTKSDVLAAVRDAAMLRSAGRMRAAVGQAQPGGAEHARIILLALLPRTPEQVEDARVLQAFHDASIRDGGSPPAAPAMLSAVLVDAAGLVEDSGGELRAQALVALSGGLVGAVLSGEHSIDRAEEILALACAELLRL
ncbi:TetR/AcrR family transcriptional regulator [Brachybacterium sp. FME24]|uniref:TetR/AcrR family transcriptional regulator n=1 Tax=Brachybacterium sp. FME24 TaxID=2742605 RepID=UPI001866DBF5|nr:TetR family transcriptional regulator [Brachybacterium sp. FME24]